MASLLRQIIASPRTRHPESNLDLCYVTPFLIATSGPSGTYPKRAYRNPLDQLVKFLDKSHGEEWCIWEFRAEGTGYPDKEVRGKVKHYPWPDHHPPPFAVVPLVMAGMRNWLREGEEEENYRGRERERPKEDEKKSNGRVVVVHCKAGKGRSGTMACSYLISECGWTKEEALARFTERRMRPGFGQGVSIPSQLRWVGYVDRWTKSGKKYVEREIEIMEVHIWGLRDGVKVAVEGYIEQGKIIKTYHVFKKHERLVVEGNPPGGAGFSDMVSDMTGTGISAEPEQIDKSNSSTTLDGTIDNIIDRAKKRKTLPVRTVGSNSSSNVTSESTDDEAGGRAVIFKPSEPLIVAGSDISLDFERRNKAGYGMAMVTSVAHVWFNAYFEGNGPEQNGEPDDTGVFEIEWERMDGIKGSLRKGTRSLDRLAVVWRARGPIPGQTGQAEIHEPGTHSPVPEMAAADWKGRVADDSTGMARDLGLRKESPASASVSKASSVRSGHEKLENDDDDLFKGVKSSGVDGSEDVADGEVNGSATPRTKDEDEVEQVDVEDLPEPTNDAPEPTLEEVNNGLDTASKTVPVQKTGD